MTKVNAWLYIDKLVERRTSLTLSRRLKGGYAACINGHFFGSGESCKAAVAGAVRDVKRRTAAVKRRIENHV